VYNTKTPWNCVQRGIPLRVQGGACATSAEERRNLSIEELKGIANMKVVGLKAELEKNGLDTKGKKSQLVRRLKDFKKRKRLKPKTMMNNQPRDTRRAPIKFEMSLLYIHLRGKKNNSSESTNVLHSS
jgi:hypothetical protein